MNVYPPRAQNDKYAHTPARYVSFGRAPRASAARQRRLSSGTTLPPGVLRASLVSAQHVAGASESGPRNYDTGSRVSARRTQEVTTRRLRGELTVGAPRKARRYYVQPQNAPAASSPRKMPSKRCQRANHQVGASIRLYGEQQVRPGATPGARTLEGVPSSRQPKHFYVEIKRRRAKEGKAYGQANGMSATEVK